MLLNLRGETTSEKGRTGVTLSRLPDVQLSKFSMSLDGGAHGILALREGVCRGRRLRPIDLPVSAVGQDGARRRQVVALGAGENRCGGESRVNPRQRGQRPAR